MIVGVLWIELFGLHDVYERVLVGFVDRRALFLLFAKRGNVIVEQKKETILVFRTLLCSCSLQLKRSLPSLLRGGESLLSLIQLARVAEVSPICCCARARLF